MEAVTALLGSSFITQAVNQLENTQLMEQSRLASFIEACVHTAAGYVTGFVTQVFLFPLYDIHVPATSNLQIAGWFGLVSLVRSYAIRRWFNASFHRFAVHLSQFLLTVRR